MKRSKLVLTIPIGAQIKIGSSDRMPELSGAIIVKKIKPVVFLFNRKNDG